MRSRKWVGLMLPYLPPTFGNTCIITEVSQFRVLLILGYSCKNKRKLSHTVACPEAIAQLRNPAALQNHLAGDLFITITKVSVGQFEQAKHRAIYGF